MRNTTLFKMSIKKDDLVQVIAGKDKSKAGKVLKLYPKTGRVLVEKINMVKRHLKPTQQNPQGGLVEKEASLHFSNILLYCQKCQKGVRHGIRAEGTTKARYCKRCDGTLDAA